MRRGLSSIELFAGLVFLSVTMPAPGLLAAPFCLQTEAISPQCNYDDPAACQRDAARQGGACVANPQEVTATEGTGAYCLAIAGGHAYCDFQDVTACVREAAHERGACIAAPVAPAPAPAAPAIGGTQGEAPGGAQGKPPQPG